MTEKSGEEQGAFREDLFPSSFLNIPGKARIPPVIVLSGSPSIRECVFLRTVNKKRILPFL